MIGSRKVSKGDCFSCQRITVSRKETQNHFKVNGRQWKAVSSNDGSGETKAVTFIDDVNR